MTRKGERGHILKSGDLEGRWRRVIPRVRVLRGRSSTGGGAAAGAQGRGGWMGAPRLLRVEVGVGNAARRPRSHRRLWQRRRRRNTPLTYAVHIAHRVVQRLHTGSHIRAFSESSNQATSRSMFLFALNTLVLKEATLWIKFTLLFILTLAKSIL